MPPILSVFEGFTPFRGDSPVLVTGPWPAPGRGPTRDGPNRLAVSLHYRACPSGGPHAPPHRVTLLTVFALAAGRAEAVTIRDVIELSKAGLSEQVLLALIEVDRGVFAIDTATLKQLKEAGVSDAVIVALIRSGRTPPPEPSWRRARPTAGAQQPREPEVIVIDHHDAPAPAAVPYPVAVLLPRR